MTWDTPAIVTVALIGVFIGIALPPVRTTKIESSAPTRRCQTIPTDVAAWGFSVQSTPSGLYFCYQQGAGQNMTEVVCVPMKDCKP